MRLIETRPASRNPWAILARFRLGQDTATIAAIIGEPEHVVYRLLNSARDFEWSRKQEAACAAWNASLKPVEQDA
jgi:hypothetical protein